MARELSVTTSSHENLHSTRSYGHGFSQSSALPLTNGAGHLRVATPSSEVSSPRWLRDVESALSEARLAAAAMADPWRRAEAWALIATIFSAMTSHRRPP